MTYTPKQCYIKLPMHPLPFTSCAPMHQQHPFSTSAGRSLPVSPNPNPALANLYVIEQHYTAASKKIP